MRELPAGLKVLVYFSYSGSWEGPFRIINIGAEAVMVQVHHDRQILRSSFVKPVVTSMHMEGHNGDRLDERHAHDDDSGNRTQDEALQRKHFLRSF